MRNLLAGLLLIMAITLTAKGQEQTAAVVEYELIIGEDGRYFFQQELVDMGTLQDKVISLKSKSGKQKMPLMPEQERGFHITTYFDPNGDFMKVQEVMTLFNNHQVNYTLKGVKKETPEVLENRPY